MDNDWFLQWYGAIFPIFSMRFANKKLGMGRDGFCQGIASISNMLILPTSLSLSFPTSLSLSFSLSLSLSLNGLLDKSFPGAR